MVDILLDPGHGSQDPGAIGQNGTKEKDINLKISLKVGKLLNERDVSIAYTRTTDILLGTNVNLDLKERVRLANEVYKPKYFVSIHNNAHSSPSAKGTETYIVGTGGNAEKLAQKVHPSLIKSTGLYDRGIKTANFYVLKYTDMPAILIECAFLSNPDEEKLLNDDNFLNKIAEGIAKGICEFLGKKWEMEMPVSDAWKWALNLGIVKQENKTKEVENAVNILYELNNPKVTIPKHESKYDYIGTTHVIEIDPMALKCKDMVLKSGNQLANEYQNFVNANFFLWENGKPKKTVGWLVSEGKILAKRYEDLDYGWKGNPKGTLIVYKDGKVEIGWKWDSELRAVENDIWFCVQGFNLFPPNMTVKKGIAKEGFDYSTTGYTTTRLSIGYNPITKKIVIAVRPDSDAERAQLTMKNLSCEGNAICLDSGLSVNMVYNGKKLTTTDRQLASIIYW